MTPAERAATLADLAKSWGCTGIYVVIVGPHGETLAEVRVP